MSDPKRATLITVDAAKSANKKVYKTVRLTINLHESNESKYPELNYEELVIAEEKKHCGKVENGKTTGLDPFSDNNEDVERIARKFEQKYGGKSTYSRKGSMQDDFADIGAGYDENDSFIDNTHGYDEMIPPECDTLYGGFYINCGSLEFKNVPENQVPMSDEEVDGGRRNKRRISSSSSEKECSESCSESESQDEKDPKAIANGELDSHNTEHRKKKNKKSNDKKASKIRRTDSSAATSGKQTSDDNAHGDGESADSQTSQSDSLASKPAPSSENAITSDSSRDGEAKVEVKLPLHIENALEALEIFVKKQLVDKPTIHSKELVSRSDELINGISVLLSSNACSSSEICAVWNRVAAALRCPRAKLLPLLKDKLLPALRSRSNNANVQSTGAQPISSATSTSPRVTSPTAVTTLSTTTITANTSTTSVVTSSVTTQVTVNNKRKYDDDLADFDPELLTPEEREAIIVETLDRLRSLIEERKPAMVANYNAECERVQLERKKIQMSKGEGAPPVEKRLPKRRFPWCGRARALLSRLARAAPPGPASPTSPSAPAPAPGPAELLLRTRALPLFPQGFVRMPTLLRQANINITKASDQKRQRLGSTSQPAANPTPAQFTEPIQFPSSLTVTTTNATKHLPEKTEVATNSDDKFKCNSSFGTILNSFSLSKDLIVDKTEKKDPRESLKNEEPYVPPNNIGSITITPVLPNLAKSEKKHVNNVSTNAVAEKQPGFIRVKSPAALNDMVVKKDKLKKHEKIKEKRVGSPLHIDTTHIPSKKDPSPKSKEEIPQKAIENMRAGENNIPRPAIIPVHHSPTFAKPDKRPPDMKKKKDVLIVSDVDPLSDNQEPLSVDDSSSDVELVEDNCSRTDKNETKRDKKVTVPCKERVNINVDEKVNNKCRKEKETAKSESEVSTNDEFETVMRSIKELEHSQEPTKSNSNSYGGVISNDQTSLNKEDGCNTNAEHKELR